MMTERDPNGIDAHAPGAKLDAGKAELSIVLPPFGLALSEVAGVGAYGRTKYSLHGWESVPNGVTRYTDAMFRHLLAEHRGARDVDTGLLHAAHAAWNGLARLELMLRETK